MKQYPWLRPSFEQLVGSYQAGRGHHALLLQFLSGTGGEALIYALYRFLMCRQPEGHKNCGHYHSCQLMQAGTHSDYYPLIPEEGRSVLSIDVVRDINEKLYERACLGGAKVVWVSDAALLTDVAANALPKMLEEPSENTWFFLACQEPARLLTTLRSRCCLHRLAPPPESYALAWLEREVSLPQESLLTMLRLCASAPVAAPELLQEPQWTAWQQLCQTLAATLASGDWLALLPIFNHEQAVVRLHWLASLPVDAQKRQQGTALVSNPDVWSLLEQLAHSLPAARLQAIARDVCTCREQLLNVVGVNRELLLTERLLRWEHYLQPGVVLPVSHL